MKFQLKKNSFGVSHSHQNKEPSGISFIMKFQKLNRIFEDADEEQ